MLNYLDNTIYIYILINILTYILMKKYLFKTTLIFAFIGTVFHELMHFSIGLILLAKPTLFSLIPKKTNEGYTLGSVSFQNINFFNALPTSMAPLILIPISLYLIFISFAIDNELIKIPLAFLITNLLISSKPSSADFNIMFSSKFGIFLYLGIISIIIIKEVKGIEINNINIFIDSVWNIIS